MDGRTVWPDSFERARGAGGIDDGKPIRLVPTTSFLLLPVTVEGEDLPTGFQFAREKARALAAWPDALAGGTPPLTTAAAGGLAEVGELTPRAKRGERKEAQSDLDLPAYPTTTTGSLPQTAEVRQLRVRLGKGSWSRPTTKPKWRASSPTGWLAGAHRPGRDRPRRVRADRHGRVLRRADGRVLHDPRRVGALVREPMRARRSSPRRRPSASR